MQRRCHEALELTTSGGALKDRLVGCTDVDKQVALGILHGAEPTWLVASLNRKTVSPVKMN